MTRKVEDTIRCGGHAFDCVQHAYDYICSCHVDDADRDDALSTYVEEMLNARKGGTHEGTGRRAETATAQMATQPQPFGAC